MKFEGGSLKGERGCGGDFSKFTLLSSHFFPATIKKNFEELGI